MITVDSSIHPVYSDASGKTKRADKKVARKDARSTRKASRKARRLKRVKLRNGKSATVYVLTKLQPKRSSFDGDAFSYVDDAPTGTATTATAPTTASALNLTQEFVKNNADGTQTIIKKEDVVQASTGAYYDKNEVAKVYMVDKATVTQPMIDRVTVAVAPTADGQPTAEQQKTTNSDLAIVVPDNKIKLDENGQPFLDTDLVEGGDEMTEAQKAELAKQQAEEDKKKRTRRIMIGVGIGVVVLVAGIIIYRRMNK